MIPLYTENEFESSKSTDKLPLKCKYCDSVFHRTKYYIQGSLNPNKLKQTGDFCSHKCVKRYNDKKNNRTPKKVNCKQCNKEFLKLANQIKKSPNHFCSQSCAAIYNNTHKKHGTRTSKLEAYLQKVLPEKYPDLEFHFNRKDAINSELDIYIPSLKLAFELNGIFHYEPIYGQDKLDKIQNNDQRKFAACIENNISLCIIDTSSQNYFKESTSQKFVDIICNIINKNL